MTDSKIIQGDCLDEMAKMEANSISCIVTDPPFGISFMGKAWDRGIPSQEYWKEMLRVVKPGGHLLVAGLPRMMHRLICVVEDSGWEIRDLIMHIFGSGFPKSHNHFGIEGYGTALKPAWEGWSLCMKPCDGTFKNNAQKWGQAGINIDGCRIGIDQIKIHRGNTSPCIYGNYKVVKEYISEGRWPANVLFDEEAAKMLDEQSAFSKSPKIGSTTTSEGKGIGDFGFKKMERSNGYGDSGGASRFFYCAKASSSERNEGLDHLEMQKAGIKNDSGRGFSESDPMKPIQYKNNHPTVKPLKLMEYLIKLVMPPKDGILLDPFAGSGTTILAAKRLGFTAIGIEKCEEYSKIARARINVYK